MDLPRLQNRNPAAATLLPTLTTEGWALLVVIKQRYGVDRGVATPQDGAEIRHSDELWSPDHPETSGIRYPHDIAPGKPSTDILVVGDAVAPGGRPVSALDVRVEVGSVGHSLRVFGPRAWYQNGARCVPTAPIEFERAPIRWENAFGGTDDTEGLLEEPRNPVGIGIAARPERLVGRAMPQVEDPAHPLESSESRPPPAGFGAIGPQFEPRRTYAGTHDDRWIRERMPLPPLDFDERFNMCAPGALQAPTPLLGGEAVRILGMHEDGVLAFELPRIAFSVESSTARGVIEHRAMLDTVLLEPNELRFELTWRACLPWARSASNQPVRIVAETG